MQENRLCTTSQPASATSRVPRTYDPAAIDLHLVRAGFQRRFGAEPAALTERLGVVRMFVDGATPEQVAAEMALRLGQVRRTLGFAMNLSMRCDRSGRPVPKNAAFAELSVRIQNVFAHEGIKTRAAAHALFDEKGHLIRKLPKLGSTSIASIACWLGHPSPIQSALAAKSLDERLAKAIALLRQHGPQATTTTGPHARPPSRL